MKLDISDEMIAERRGGSGPMPKICLNGWHLQLQKLIYLVNGLETCLLDNNTFNICYDLRSFSRKLFTAPTMWAYDMSRFMYGALFMLGQVMLYQKVFI